MEFEREDKIAYGIQMKFEREQDDLAYEIAMDFEENKINWHLKF